MFHIFTKKINKEKKKDFLIKTNDRICPVCGGKGYSINDNHYIADNDIFKRYIVCNHCNGTGICPYKK